MIELTKLERQLLDDMTHDCFYDNGVDSEIWTDCFLDGSSIPTEQAKGVISSLIKKGILNPMLGGRDSIMSFTEQGKQLMIELGYEA